MPTNERLRGSLASARLSAEVLAAKVGVDPKTVERWVTTGRCPHPTHRAAVADVLGVAAEHLWPGAAARVIGGSTAAEELVEIHPTRTSVPAALWQHLISSTHEALDILTYAGTFLFDQHDIVTVLRAKSSARIPCRFLLGDESSDAVRLRADEERTVGGLQGRIQLNRRYLHDVVGLPSVEIRVHATTLYNSLFRFDDELLVNGHAYGAPAGCSPVIHLRRVPGGRMWEHYMRSFEDVWSLGRPVEGAG